MEGKLIDVTQADKKIDYSCPDCSSVLRKRGGDIVTDHFYHFTPSECTGESVIHKAYKQALLECKELCYRDYMGNLKCLQFDRVELEKGFNGGSIIVDAVGYINNIMHFIEFANTHYIDERKRKKIEKSDIFCIEITIPNDIKTFDRIKTFLTHSGYNRKVIHNPLTKNLKADYDELKKKIVILNENIEHLKDVIRTKNKEIRDLNNELKYLDKYVKKQDKELDELEFHLIDDRLRNKKIKEYGDKIDSDVMNYRINLKANLTTLKSYLNQDMFNNSDKAADIIKSIEEDVNYIRTLENFK
jgi:hypothetical protein